jgi:hypothetical protein
MSPHKSCRDGSLRIASHSNPYNAIDNGNRAILVERDPRTNAS